MRPTRSMFDRHVARIEACIRNSAHVEQCLAIIVQVSMSRFADIGRPFADDICAGEHRWRIIW